MTRFNEIQQYTTTLMNYTNIMLNRNTQSQAYITYDTICKTLKSSQINWSCQKSRQWLFEGAWTVVMTRSHHKYSFQGAGNALCLDLGVSYEGEHIV